MKKPNKKKIKASISSGIRCIKIYTKHITQIMNEYAKPKRN